MTSLVMVPQPWLCRTSVIRCGLWDLFRGPWSRSCQVGATVVGMGFLLEKARTVGHFLTKDATIEFDFLLEAPKQLIFHEIQKNNQVMSICNAYDTLLVDAHMLLI